MWIANGNDLTMCEGDWGIQLPITVSGVTLTASDSLKFTLKVGNVVITKDFSDIVQNTVMLEFTEEETALIPVGTYQYSFDWYQDGAFMCNIVPAAFLRVVDKV